MDQMTFDRSMQHDIFKILSRATTLYLEGPKLKLI
jgi:hypothetical protein